MINGAHAIVYSTNADADRAFLRDVLGLPHVDVGGGWLIFGLPPAEVAVHPSDANDAHELYFMCDDVNAFVAAMAAREVACSAIADRGWGLLTSVTLPSGGSLGVYQPRHARPAEATRAAAPRKRPTRARRKAVRKREPAVARAKTKKKPKRR